MYYTYFHIKNDSGHIFYVGKGKDNRCNVTSGRSSAWVETVKVHGLKVEIVELFQKEEDALAHETYLIASLKDLGVRLVNFTNGGEGTSGFKVREETKLKISSSQKGRKLTPEHIAAMRAGQKGKKRSEEARRNMSAAFKGRKHSEETKAKMSASRKGRKTVFDSKEAHIKYVTSKIKHWQEVLASLTNTL